MRKYSILLTTLGGALAGYLLSDEKLRKELAATKDPTAAAKTLGKHLSEDGQKLAKEVKNFVESDDVQKNIKKAKHFAATTFTEAKKEIVLYVKKQHLKSRVRGVAKRGVRVVKRVVS